MREKIHAFQPLQRISCLERPGVPRQRGRVAGYIQNASGAQFQQAVQSLRGQPGARGVGQRRIPDGGAVAPQPFRQCGRVRGFVTAVRQAGLFRIAPGPRPGALVLFQAQHALKGRGRQLAGRAHAAVQIQQG